MKYAVRCEGCGCNGKVPKEMLGAEVRCPKCGEVFALTREAIPRMRVLEVREGDILVVDVNAHTGGESAPVRVRLLGVDTIEVRGRKSFHTPAAEEFARERLLGRDVFLEFDYKEEDDFGNKLAYVWLFDEGVMFNEMFIQEGHAEVHRGYKRIAHFPDFMDLESQAIVAGRGIWAKG
ncbi:MAG: thermonuclease family protein [Planctomycetes bacterium]|nr:thermonuclease family protein [Planctomycetota bacterium]